MDSTISGRKFTLREVAPVAFLNNLIPSNEWEVEIDEKVRTVTVNGDPSDNVCWNETLRTLVWTNWSAEGFNLASGALSFERDFTSCHGRVTTSDESMYLVESLPEQGEVHYSEKAAGYAPIDLVEFGFDEPPAYPAIEVDVIEKPQYYMMANSSLASEVVEFADSKMEMTSQVMASSDMVADVAEAEQRPISTIKVLTYKTQKRLRTDDNDEDWETFATLSIGSEYSTMLHPVIVFDTDEITNYVHVDQDSNHYVKGPQKAGDPCAWSFDVTFTGRAESRIFSGSLVNAKGKVFDWQGSFSTMTSISREGTNQRVKGSDGLSLDQLLQGVTSMSRTTEIGPTGVQQLVDLAQKEADRVFGRLVFGSVDQEVSNLLFPGIFSLTPAEKDIQKLGEEFLKRAGIHSIMANLKASDNVKAKTKDKISKAKCERFIPMCISAGAAPTDPANDPVKLYGLDREKDKTLVTQLQSQAQSVSRACYLHGYRTAVISMQGYLNNAGEWYDILVSTLTSDVYLADWQSRASGSEGLAKTLYDIHTKLDLLWETANANPTLKAKLPAGIKTPAEVIATLNVAGLDAALDSIEFDDTARQGVVDFFERLDELEKDKRTETLAQHYRKQMIVDDAKRVSFQEMGNYVVDLMNSLRQNKKWSMREATAQLSLLDAARVRQEAGAAAPPWYKDIKWKEGFMSYFRSAVTVVAMSGLVYLFSQNAAKMDWDDQLALFGQLSEGFVAVRGAMSKMAQAGAGGAMSIGAFLHKWFLAPIAKVCRFVGEWLYRRIGDIGRGLIQGIGRLLVRITDAIKTGAEIVATKVGSLGTWLKNLPINWGKIFQSLAKIASFGISALCFWIAIRDCIAAYKSGRPIDIIMSTIGAAIVGLEVLCLVIQGLAWIVGAVFTSAAATSGVIISACAALGPILAAAGIVFAVALIIVAFAFQEDPMDDFVEKYGRKYGIVG
ncbi:hypothetical protein B0T10DRAFT_502528 [Thelonectria olida]|uniref:Uncharacterized protein n=1 Tax=Thelonectria olida TaxID=1576542 RepID=A0A9P8VN23_9HYPO|nr:hypothetical protein B0T10DRAFT_502528 [Thelonectria olida]